MARVNGKKGVSFSPRRWYGHYRFRAILRYALRLTYGWQAYMLARRRKGNFMDGYILLADGKRLNGTLKGARKTVMGWLAANTAVVGFQEMVTDPAYKGRILAFTYPEIGNIGIAGAFSESPRVQVAGLVVKVLSEFRSHYLSEDSLENLLVNHDVPCLTDVDTRGLAVHLRENGEMPAMIAPASEAPSRFEDILAALDRPCFEPSKEVQLPAGANGPNVAVLNLGIRRSVLQQLDACCVAKVFPYDTAAETILAAKPAGVFVSDGPSNGMPPEQAVTALQKLVAAVPILACGLGHVALGMALGAKPVFLKRGHHGVNCPVRDVRDRRVEITAQRHTVALDRESLTRNKEVVLVSENVNDGSVEGIGTADGRATGRQSILASPWPGAVHPQIQHFVDGLKHA